MPIINQVVAGSGGSAPAHYIEKTVDANGVLKNSSNFIDLTGVNDIALRALSFSYYNGVFSENTIITIPCSRLTFGYALYYAFSTSSLPGDNKIKSITFPNLTIISGDYTLAYFFENSSKSLESIIFDKLETVSGGHAFEYAFRFTMTNQGNIQIVHFPKLETVSGEYAFRGCFSTQDALNQASMPSLKTISSQRAFDSVFTNTLLQSFKFESLNTITGNQVMRAAFNGCSLLQSLWFYALDTNSFGPYTSQFYAMLGGCINVTVHFPIRIQSTIGSWTDVTNGFGGTNTTVLFDLVTSLTGADGNTYTRQEKDSTSTATAWVYNDTLYYTSGVSDNTNGVNEPAVSDAIYSDAACTQSVTTITAIA